MKWRGTSMRAGSAICASKYRLSLMNDDNTEGVYYDFQCQRFAGHDGVHVFNPELGNVISAITWEDQ